MGLHAKLRQSEAHPPVPTGAASLANGSQESALPLEPLKVENAMRIAGCAVTINHSCARIGRKNYGCSWTGEGRTIRGSRRRQSRVEVAFIINRANAGRLRICVMSPGMEDMPSSLGGTGVQNSVIELWRRLTVLFTRLPGRCARSNSKIPECHQRSGWCTSSQLDSVCYQWSGSPGSQRPSLLQ